MPDGCKVIPKINQAFLDNNHQQPEALLHPHKVLDFGVSIDNRTCHHLAPNSKSYGQGIMVDKSNYKMKFDGWNF